MEEYLSFRKMVTPVIIQVIFWLVAAGIVIVGLVTLTQNALFGIGIIVFGLVGARVYAELLIVLFEINAAVQDIRANVARPAAPAPPTS